jgi:P4 family phage/plasmid primase-like protien
MSLDQNAEGRLSAAPTDPSPEIYDQDTASVDALQTIIDPGAVVELRVPIRKGRTIRGYYDDHRKLIDDARKIDGKYPAIYITMNPVDPALLARCAYRGEDVAADSTNDRDVTARRWILVDLDPVRPANISATDDEHQAALDKAEEIAKELIGHGFPDPVLMDSGNGAYVLVPVDLPNDETSRDLVERFLAALQTLHGDDRTKIDTSVGNASRIMRLPGTLNAKGDNLPERPHRRARLVHVPAIIDPTPAELIEAMIEEAGTDPEPPTAAAPSGRFDLEAFVAEHLADRIGKHGPWKGAGYLWELNPCPFNEEHNRGEAWVARQPSGRFAAGCRHDSCTWKWRDLREKFDPKANRQSLKGTDDRFTDAMMAETVAEEVLADRYIWADGLGWLAWTGQQWRGCSDATVGEGVRAWSGEQFKTAVDELLAGKGNQQTMDGWRMMLNAGKESAVLRLARGIVEHQVEELDADPDLINTPSGVVDLRTGELGPHDPDLLMTKITRGSYRPGYQHPDWTAALEALRAPERAWLQVRTGQGATGHPTPDGIMPVLQGSGENGKSLVMTDGIVPALGDYASMASAKLFQASKGSEHSTERADLRGRRVLVAEELTEGRSIDVTALKQIQDVPRIKARYIRQNNIEFQASHSLFTTTNYVPIVAEVDHGTWRRLALLRFLFTFRKPGEELEADTDKRGDPELKARIRAGRDGQHDAVVTWIVDGARRWYADPARSLELTPAIAADTRAWRVEADRILGFWDEYLIADRDGCILTAEAHDVFNDWLSTNGHREWPKETFGPRFIQHQETARHRVDKVRRLNPKGLSRPADPLFPARVRAQATGGLPGRPLARRHRRGRGTCRGCRPFG